MPAAKTLRLSTGGVDLVADLFAAGAASRGRVVLLHGGGQTRHSWSGSGSRLAAAGWDVVAPDARGHGDSGWAGDGDYSLRALVADLTAWLESFDGPSVLCGASLGGNTALALQPASPGLSRALILVDIVPSAEPAGVTRILDFMSGNAGGFATLDEAADAVTAYNPHRPRPRTTAGLRKNLRLRDDGRWHWHWDPAFLDHSPREPYREAQAQTLIEAAKAVTIPTLLVRGGASDVVSAEGVDELLTLIPHASYVEVAATGHMVAGDDNDTFGVAVESFLDTLE